MDEMNHALLLEALSDKVLHQLPPAVWKQLFLGEGRDSIHFERRQLTLVHADAVLQLDGLDAWESFSRKLQPLAVHYRGRLDPYNNAMALVTFEDPSAGVRMALALQRISAGVGLQVGVVTGPCILAFFRVQGRLWCTPLGAEPARAAQVAASANLGGVVISPETYAPVPSGSVGDSRIDFANSEVDLSTLSTLSFMAADHHSGPAPLGAH
jgi:class 3 adenylate cyclase